MVHLRQPQRGKRPPAVINVKRIPGLGEIDVGADAIRLGSLTTLTALIEHPIIQAEYPVLPFTARYMGSPAIRHRGDGRRQPVQRLTGGRSLPGAARPRRRGGDRRSGRSASAAP